MNKRMVELSANTIDEYADILINSGTCNEAHLMGLLRIKSCVKTILIECAKE